MRSSETIVAVATLSGMGIRLVWFATAVTAAVVVAACTSSEPTHEATMAVPTVSSATVSPGAAPAVWRPATGGAPDPRASTVDVLVTRVSCSSGVTGDVVAPSIQQAGDRVVVTFEVTPEVTVARCPSNDWVPYRIDLGAPLGGRQLVDGRCLPGADPDLTQVCESLRDVGDPSRDEALRNPAPSGRTKRTP
jgi:hypothetical protein